MKLTTFYTKGDLVLTAPGETCEKLGLIPIASQHDCRASQGFIEKYQPDYRFKKEVNNSTLPTGCFVWLSFDPGMDDKGYFNIHPTGAGQERSKALCRLAEGK